MREVTVGGWSFAVLEDARLVMSESEVERLERELISPWEKHFPREETWVWQNVGKPSLLIRVDMAFQKDGSCGIYEIEERPAGMGVAVEISPAFHHRLRTLYHAWTEAYGRLAIVVSSKRSNGDDELLCEHLGVDVWRGLPPAVDGSLYFVRAEPHEVEYHQLGARSVTTLRTEGDKRYGVPLGLWRRIPDNLDDLPWQSGFALKPKQGSKMRNVYLWHPSRPKGTETKGKLRKVIQDKKVYYIQDWISPETPEFLPKGYFLIRRIFWGWHPGKKQWICLGGLWNARPNVRLHGATDAIFGEVTCP